MTVITHGEASVRQHESWHCSSAILDGMMPKSVSVDMLGLYDYAPNKRTTGVMKVDWERYGYSDKSLKAHVVALLMGTKCHGQEREAVASAWPIDPTQWQSRNESDARHIALIVDLLELDQAAWGQLCQRAKDRTRDRRFLLLAGEIARELEDTGYLSRDDLITIAKRVLDDCTIA